MKCIRNWVPLIIFGLAGLGVAPEASSEPERNRPGQSYYSDELSEPTHQGLVRALGRSELQGCPCFGERPFRISS